MEYLKSICLGIISLTMYTRHEGVLPFPSMILGYQLLPVMNLLVYKY